MKKKNKKKSEFAYCKYQSVLKCNGLRHNKTCKWISNGIKVCFVRIKFNLMLLSVSTVSSGEETCIVILNPFMLSNLLNDCRLDLSYLWK